MSELGRPPAEVAVAPLDRARELFRQNPQVSFTLLALLVLVLLLYLPWPFPSRVVLPSGRLVELVDGTRDRDVTALAVGANQVWVGTRYTGLMSVSGNALGQADRGAAAAPQTVLGLQLTDLQLWGAAGVQGLFILAGADLQQPKVPFGLQGLQVTCLARGADRMWVGTDQGLLSYNLAAWSTYLMKGRQRPPAVTALLEQGSTLWVGTSEGLYSFNGDWNPVPLGASGGAEPRILALLAGTGGQLLVGSARGLSLVAPGGAVSFAAGLETPVRALVSLGAEVWAGGEGGLYHGPGTGPFSRVTGLPYDRVTVLAAEPARLWVGTDRGLFSYQQQPGAVVAPPQASLPFPAASPSSLLPAPPSSSLPVPLAPVASPNAPPPAAGMGASGALDVWASPGAPQAGFEVPAALGAVQVFTVKADRARDRLWLGTEGGALVYDGAGSLVARYSVRDGLPDDRVHAVDVEDGARARIFVGTMGGLAVLDGTAWTTYTRASGALVDDNVWAVRAAADAAWVGTDGGLQALDGRGQWQTWSIANAPLAENWIQSLASDSRGALWVGIWNGGVARFARGRWDTFADPDGLPEEDAARNDGVLSEAVMSAVVDGRDHLWVATTRGLCRFDGTSWFDYDHPDFGVAPPPLTYLEVAPDDETLVVCSRAGFTLLKGTRWRTYLPARGAGASVLVREGDARQGGLQREYYLGAPFPSSFVWSAGFLGRNLVLGLEEGSVALRF